MFQGARDLPVPQEESPGSGAAGGADPGPGGLAEGPLLADGHRQELPRHIHSPRRRALLLQGARSVSWKLSSSKV